MKTNAPDSHPAHDHAPRYEIRVEGHLSDRLIAGFPDATSERRSDGTTALHLPARDQAALHAVLRSVRDLGLTLLSVTRCDPRTPMPPP